MARDVVHRTASLVDTGEERDVVDQVADWLGEANKVQSA